MGYEALAYFGTKGSTASTNLTNVRDITYGITTERGDTTVRGDSSVPPIETHNVTKRIYAIEITILHNSSDASLTAIMVAANAGTAIAIRTKSYSSGLGYDGDCTVEVSKPWPLAGEQVITVTCHPNGDDRTPLGNS